MLPLTRSTVNEATKGLAGCQHHPVAHRFLRAEKPFVETHCSCIFQEVTKNFLTRVEILCYTRHLLKTKNIKDVGSVKPSPFLCLLFCHSIQSVYLTAGARSVVVDSDHPPAFRQPDFRTTIQPLGIVDPSSPNGRSVRRHQFT